MARFSNFSPDVLESISKLEQKLTMPDGFCESLLSENDWSFIIKTHAMFEAALSQLLCHHVGKPELKNVFARLEMSNTSTGKLAFAKELGYMEDDERRFIRKWSELRNSLVHDVTNTSFALKPYLLLMTKKQQQVFLNGFFMEEWFQPNIKTDEGFSKALESPSLFLYYGAITVLSLISDYFMWADHDKRVEHLNWLERLVNLETSVNNQKTE